MEECVWQATTASDETTATRLKRAIYTTRAHSNLGHLAARAHPQNVIVHAEKRVDCREVKPAFLFVVNTRRKLEHLRALITREMSARLLTL